MRQKNTWTILRALFARSGNRCSFGGCSHELINGDGLFVAEVCHIRAAQPGGPRYDSKQTDAARRGEKNLLLLCHAHHVVIDSRPKVHTARNLERMKRSHESGHRAAFRVEREVLDGIAKDIDAYWLRTAALHGKARRSGVPAVELRLGQEPVALIRSMRQLVARLEATAYKIGRDADELPSLVKTVLAGIDIPTKPWDDLAYYKNPVCRWNWGELNLFLPNCLIDLRNALVQLDVKLAEKDHLQNPKSRSVRLRLATARRELEGIAENAVYND